MKLLKKTIIIVIILVASILITWKFVYKNNEISKISSKDKYHITDQNKVKSLPSKASKDIPHSILGLECLTRPIINNGSSARVLYCSPNKTLKKVALTFDDGPDTYYTPQILEILKRNDIKATFFIVGLRAQAHPEMVRRMVNEGHSIGNHTWDHPLLSKLPPDRVKEQVQKTEQLLYKITGFNTAMFRPPYGSTTSQVTNEISSLGYKMIDWSIDTRDWDKTPVPQIMNYVSTELYPGGIILQHCAGGDLSNTVKALPQIISSLKSKGYSFVLVQDLLDIPGSKSKICNTILSNP